MTRCSQTCDLRCLPALASLPPNVLPIIPLAPPLPHLHHCLSSGAHYFSHEPWQLP